MKVDNEKHELVRRRAYLTVAIVATVVVGLASRKFPWLFSATLGKYPGDVLWAQMVYWGVRFLIPSASIAKVATYSLSIAFIDELSQLYQVPWINNIRATTLGHLVLGSTFSWLDMLSYLVGVILCGVFELILSRGSLGN